jgi:hypothetical protein
MGYRGRRKHFCFDDEMSDEQVHLEAHRVEASELAGDGVHVLPV